MFNIRSTWIPTYFIDSSSESENSFFSHFTNSGSTLMNFMNCFETAMEKQRHVQERMDHKTIDIVPKLKTLLKIEHHASNVYTRSLFELVQKEIFVGLFYCQIDSKCLVEGSEVCIIKESPYVYEMPNKKKKKPQSVDKGNDKAEENDKVDLFFKKDGLYKNVVVENYANEATSIVDHCVHLLSKDKPRNSCSLCGGTDHNKRTCPRRFEGQDEVVFQKEVGQEEVLVQKEVCQEEVVQESVDLAKGEEELSKEDEDLIHE
ncbi:protein FAR1-related sequence 5 [Tanacetum coccineum]